MVERQPFRRLVARVAVLTPLAVLTLLAVPTLLVASGGWAVRPAETTATSPVVVERIERPGLPLRGVVARVDLTDERVRVVCPAAGPPPSPPMPPFVTTLQTVSEVARREGLEVAVNGDFFSVAGDLSARRPFVVGAPAMPLGTAVSGGRPIRLGGRASAHSLVVRQDGSVGIVSGPVELAGVSEVVSGNRLLVKDGRPQVAHQDDDVRAPRTAVGVTADGKGLILVVLDGRSIRSRGVTLGEAAALLVELGANVALNLDGGGSSVMVARTPEGAIKCLTSPSDGSERPVANVLGVRIVPRP